MACHHPEQFENLRYKRSGTRSEWEYPFAAGGVNLCFSLLGDFLIERKVYSRTTWLLIDIHSHFTAKPPPADLVCLVWPLLPVPALLVG